jgi:hypothetical protein
MTREEKALLPQIKVKAFRKCRPEAKTVFWNVIAQKIVAPGLPEENYPTEEELNAALEIILDEAEYSETNLYSDNFDLVYKNIWDGSYGGTSEWFDLKDLEVGTGIYLIFLEARNKNLRAFRDTDGGQFGIWFNNSDEIINGGMAVDDFSDSTINGGNWTNIVDLSDSGDKYSGEMNSGSQILILKIKEKGFLNFKARTPDPDSGGISMKLRSTVYKIGEV